MKPSDRVRLVVAVLLCTLHAPIDVAFAAQADDGPAPEVARPKTEKYSGPPTWYAQTRVTTDYGIVSTHYWSKGPLFRAQTMVAGHPVTTIVDATHYYVYDEILGRGAAIARNPIAISEDSTRGRPFGRERDDLLNAGGELIRDGESTEDEMAFDVFQATGDAGRRRVIVTDSDPPLPVRIEMFERSSGKTGVLEYSGWQRDLNIDDSFFVPPTGVTFERVSYAQYTARVGREAIGPAPVYYRHLLHGDSAKRR